MVNKRPLQRFKNPRFGKVKGNIRVTFALSLDDLNS